MKSDVSLTTCISTFMDECMRAT